MEDASKKPEFLDQLVWRGFNISTTSSEWLGIWDALKKNRIELESNLSTDLIFTNKEGVSSRLKAYDALLGSLWDATRLIESELKEYQV